MHSNVIPRVSAALLVAFFLTSCAAPGTDMDAVALKEGLAAYENEDYHGALVRLPALAERGIAPAQNTLGRMYMQGQGVVRDFGRAFQLFKLAAQQSLPNAQNNLGVMYAGGYGVEQDFKQASVWFEQAANQGFQLAMLNLAALYESGYGVRKDPVAARDWRRKSQGMAPAKRRDEVTIMRGASAEYQQGLALYLQFKFKEASGPLIAAANQGHPEAQLKLESMYRHGQGVEHDPSQADAWARKAAAQGYSNKDGRDRILLVHTDPNSPLPGLPGDGPALIAVPALKAACPADAFFMSSDLCSRPPLSSAPSSGKPSSTSEP